MLNKIRFRRFLYICLGYVLLFFGDLRIYAAGDTKIQCSSFDGLISDAFRFCKILAPTLLILFGAIDFIGAALSAEGDMKKAGGKFVKRLAAAILVFVLPFILKVILDLAINRGVISDYLKCWY